MNDASVENPKASESMRMNRLDLSRSAAGKPNTPSAVPRLLRSPVTYLPLQAGLEREGLVWRVLALQVSCSDGQLSSRGSAQSASRSEFPWPWLSLAEAQALSPSSWRIRCSLPADQGTIGGTARDCFARMVHRSRSAGSPLLTPSPQAVRQ